MADEGEGTGILAIKDGRDTFSAQRNLDSRKRRKFSQPDPDMKILSKALKAQANARREKAYGSPKRKTMIDKKTKAQYPVDDA